MQIIGLTRSTGQYKLSDSENTKDLSNGQQSQTLWGILPTFTTEASALLLRLQSCIEYLNGGFLHL